MITVEKVRYELYSEEEFCLRVSRDGNILLCCDFEHEIEDWLSRNVLPDEYIDYKFK